MTFDKYQQKAMTTLLASANNIPYVTLGLANEAGEVAGKIKKWIRDSDSKLERLDKDALTDELGDTLWYLALLSQMLGLSLEDVAKSNIEKLSSRQNRGRLTGSGDKR